MIQANELIVGNLLNFDRFGEIRIFKIDPDHIRMCFDFNDEFNLYYKPIPITESWLLSFGFEQRDHLWSIDIDRYNKIYYNSDQKILFSGQLGFSIQHDITYIHQLQNLYFALTQKELTLNE